MVELVDRPHQAEVALLNQVEERQSPIAVALGDRDDQPQVGLDQFVLRPLPIAYQSLVPRYRSGLEHVLRRSAVHEGELMGGQQRGRTVPLLYACAISTSSSALSSGTRPISLR